MIRISIIIPYKDTPETLFELLDTIPDTPEYEVILVDDRSKNPLRRSDFRRNNLVLYENFSGGQGAGAARNIGVSKASGEWLLFADSDDWFAEDAFLVIESYINTDFDIIYFSPTSRFENSNLVANRHESYSELVREFIYDKSEWIRYRFHSPWSKMIKRDLFIKCGIAFDTTVVANDIVCSLKLGLHAGKIEASEELIYIVRQGRPDSLSLKRDEEFFDIRVDNHFKYNSILYDLDLGKFAMGGLSTFRKALSLGYLKLFHTILYFLKNEQPIFDSPSCYLNLTRRKLRKIF